MTALFELTASYSTRSVSLNAGSYSVLQDGTSFGSVVRSPVFSQVFDSQRVSVAGAPAGAREQQVRVLCESTTLAGIQALLDDIARVCEDVSRMGGGVLRHRATGGSYVTRYRVAFARVSAPEILGAVYESQFRAIVSLALVVEPFGLADAYNIFDGFSVDSYGSAGLYNDGGADWTQAEGVSTPSVSGGILATPTTTGLNVWRHTGTPHVFGDVQVTALGQGR
jgi:hypothetical protein